MENLLLFPYCLLVSWAVNYSLRGRSKPARPRATFTHTHTHTHRPHSRVKGANARPPSRIRDKSRKLRIRSVDTRLHFCGPINVLFCCSSCSTRTEIKSQNGGRRWRQMSVCVTQCKYSAAEVRKIRQNVACGHVGSCAVACHLPTGQKSIPSVSQVGQVQGEHWNVVALKRFEKRNPIMLRRL